jgi:hypothetical protein
MPEKKNAESGGAKRWRTMKLPNGKTIQVAIVKKTSQGDTAKKGK